MNKFDFIPGALVVNGKSFPAAYENLPGRVMISATVEEEGKTSTVTIEVPETDINYMLAYAVADETARQISAPETAEEERHEIISEEVEKNEEDEIMKKDETIAAKKAEEVYENAQVAAASAQDAETGRHEIISEEVEKNEEDETMKNEITVAQGKAARGPVKEKDFAGEALCGHGWTIVFDTGLNRTRVIVADNMRDTLRPIIENAGFFFSKNQGSWNKKLTHRAHRSAIALANSLWAAQA